MGLFDRKGNQREYKAHIFYTSKATRLKTTTMRSTGDPNLSDKDIVMRLQIHFPCYEKASPTELNTAAIEAFNLIMQTSTEVDVEIQEVRVYTVIKLLGNPKTN